MASHGRTIIDPDGREVVFDAGSHLHLALNRPAMLTSVETIVATVERPDYHELDPIPGRERFFRRHVLDPMRWLRVVVDFDDEPARIVTALVQNDDPRRRAR